MKAKVHVAILAEGVQTMKTDDVPDHANNICCCWQAWQLR